MADDTSLASILASVPPELRGLLATGASLRRPVEAPLSRPPLTTGVPALDRALGGGLPRGALVELVGRASSGRFSAALAALAAVTAAGEPAALVDVGGSLDPGSAGRLGVRLDRLLWAVPRRLPEAVRAAEELLAAGFPLVVLEAGLPPLRGRAAPAAWLRLARLAGAHRAMVLLSSPWRLSGAAASAVLRLRFRRGVWRGGAVRVLAGVESGISVLRRRAGAPAAPGTHRWLLPDAALADPERLPAVAPGVEAVHAAG